MHSYRTTKLHFHAVEFVAFLFSTWRRNYRTLNLIVFNDPTATVHPSPEKCAHLFKPDQTRFKGNRSDLIRNRNHNCCRFCQIWQIGHKDCVDGADEWMQPSKRHCRKSSQSLSTQFDWIWWAQGRLSAADTGGSTRWEERKGMRKETKPESVLCISKVFKSPSGLFS